MKSDKRIEELRQLLNIASDAYYNNSDSSYLTDEEFDKFKDELKTLSPDDPFLKQIGSPVKDNSHWEKREHKIAMSSLNKCNTVEEFRKWAEDIGDSLYCVNDKLDGISLDEEYENGKLEYATTRGEGDIGENIVRNVLKMKNVKPNIKNFTGNLRGEIVLFQEDFEKINEICKKNNKKPFSNPRNAASGIAKKLDGTFCEFLTVLYYNCTGNFKTEKEKFEYIESLGLKTSYWDVGTVDDMVATYEKFEEGIRAKSQYCIDGLVIKANSIELQTKHGDLGGNPKAQIAWKFEAMKGKTKLVDIPWQMGNQQILTPVAIFDTIQLGANISKASLCNVDMFLQMKLAKGDEIIVSRRNDVIPKVESISKRSGNKPFEYPKTCPICNAPTTIRGKFLYCVNEECDGNVIGGLNKYVQKVDMKGLAESTLVKLYQKELIATPADLYRLTVEDVLSCDGFAQRSAEKVIEIINSRKELNLAIFVGALNIPQFSESMTKLLIAEGYDDLDKILKITKEELVKIKGIESKTADSFLKGIDKKKQLIKDLLDVGVTIKSKQERKGNSMSNKLGGKFYIFTGAINRIDPATGKHYNRDTLEGFVIENGGNISPSMNKETNFLVQADKNSKSSKTKKAEQYGTEIIDEEEFFKRIGM